MGLKAVATLVPGGGAPVGGSGATGYLAKWTAATTLGGSATSGANASLFIDGSGNVGIGMATPGDRLTISGGGIAITGNISGATTAATSLLMDNTSGTSRFFSIGTSASAFGNFIFLAMKSGVSPGAVVACTIDRAAGVLLGPTATAVFNAAASGQGIKLPATPGNADVQTLDCYQEANLTTGTTSGITSTSGVVVLAIRITRIGRSTAYAIKISPSGGGSLTFAAGWYLTLDGALPPAFPGALAAASTDATIDRGSVWISDINPPSIYGLAATLTANIPLLINGII